MVKRIIIVLLAVLTLTLAVACGRDSADDTTPPDTTPAVTEPPVKQVSIALTGEVPYKIIRDEDAEEDVKSLGAEMWHRFYDVTGNHDIRIADDFVKKEEEADNDELEILLGLSNRPESAEALAALPTYMDYSISVIGNKIAIAANTAARLVDAVDHFFSCITMVDGVAVYKADQVVIGAYGDYALPDLTLLDKPISDYVIVTPADGVTETAFAATLAEWFATSCGYKPAVVDDSAPAASAEIILGAGTRANGVTEEGLERGDCKIKTEEGKLIIVALASGGYKLSMQKLEQMFTANGVTPNTEQIFAGDNTGIDGARVMFIGNSFTYYGHCCGSKENNPLGGIDKRYFYKVAQDFGDEVTVTNFTLGSAYLWHKGSDVPERSLYQRLISNYPNYYNNAAGRPMHDIYRQDHVILQQAGSNVSATYSDALAIMKLFPPETKFYFYITTHDLSSNHTPTIQAAERLRAEGRAEYIPLGHMVYKIWTGSERVQGGSVRYNKSTFIVNQSSSDGYHPNHLTGYLTALMTYCTITGRSAEGADYSFVVKDDKTYYTNGTTNYPDVLESPEDMAELQRMIDRYVEQYREK